MPSPDDAAPGEDVAATTALPTPSIADDLAAISLTAEAKAAASSAGASLEGLLAHARQHVTDLKHLLIEILRLHPAGGDDAENHSALTAILAKLNG